MNRRGLLPPSFTTEDILAEVNKVEKVVESYELKPYEVQLNAAIGLSLDFFSCYQTYLLHLRREGHNSDIGVLSAKDNETPQVAIARACNSLQSMNRVIADGSYGFIVFSEIVSDITQALSIVSSVSSRLTSPRDCVDIPFDCITVIPAQKCKYIPTKDRMENLMNIFGHFKKTSANSTYSLDRNIVVLNGPSGHGITVFCMLLLPAISLSFTQLGKYDFVRWMPMDSLSIFSEWLAFASALHLLIPPNEPLKNIVSKIYNRLRGVKFLLIFDNVDSFEALNECGSFFGERLPTTKQHIIVTTTITIPEGFSDLINTTTDDNTGFIDAVILKRLHEKCYESVVVSLEHFSLEETKVMYTNMRFNHTANHKEGISSNIEHISDIHDGLSGFPLGLSFFFFCYSARLKKDKDISLLDYWKQYGDYLIKCSHLSRYSLREGNENSLRNMIVSLWTVLENDLESTRAGSFCNALCKYWSVVSVGHAIPRIILERGIGCNVPCETLNEAFDLLLNFGLFQEINCGYVCNALLHESVFYFLFGFELITDTSKLSEERGLCSFAFGRKPQFTNADEVSDCVTNINFVISEFRDAMEEQRSVSVQCHPFFGFCMPSLLTYSSIFAHLTFMSSLLSHFLDVYDTLKNNCDSSIRKTLCQVHLVKAQLFLFEERYDDAIELLPHVKALLNQSFVPGHRNIDLWQYYHAVALGSNGEYKQSLDELKALSLEAACDGESPYYCRAKVSIANILLNQNCDMEALRVLESVISTDSVECSQHPGQDNWMCFLKLKVGKMKLSLEGLSDAKVLFEPILESLHGENRTRNHSLLMSKASYCMGLAFTHENDFNNAIVMFNSALSQLSGVCGTKNHFLASQIYSAMGCLYLSEQKYAESEDSYERSKQILCSITCKAYSVEVGIILTRLGLVHQTKGSYALARTRYQEALEQFQDVESIHLADTLQCMATLHATEGKFLDALAQYKVVLAMQSRVLPENHRTLAKTVKEIGEICESLGRYKEAEGHFMAALSIERECLPEVHINIARTLHCIGHVCSKDGNYETALTYYEKAIVLKKLLFGEEHVEVVSTLSQIGYLQKYRGQYEVALALHSDVLRLKKLLYGEDSPSVSVTREMIGKIKRLNALKCEAEHTLMKYINCRRNEIRPAIGISKDAKIDAAGYLLKLLGEEGLERFSNLERTVGYYKHKAAIENGRLKRIVSSIQTSAFTNFK